MKAFARWLLLWCAIGVVVVLLLAGVVHLFGAQDRAISSPDRIAAITVEPKMDMSGTMVALILTAHFQSIEAKPSGEVTAIPTAAVQIDLVKSNGSVVVGGTQYEDKELGDLLSAVVWREYRKAFPEPLPQRRRALRSP